LKGSGPSKSQEQVQSGKSLDAARRAYDALAQVRQLRSEFLQLREDFKTLSEKFDQLSGKTNEAFLEIGELKETTAAQSDAIHKVVSVPSATIDIVQSIAEKLGEEIDALSRIDTLSRERDEEIRHILDTYGYVDAFKESEQDRVDLRNAFQLLKPTHEILKKQLSLLIEKLQEQENI